MIQIDVDDEEAIRMTEERINFFDTNLIGQDAFKKLGEFLVFKIRDAIQNDGHVVTGELLGSVEVMDVGEDYVIVGSDKLQARILEHGRIEVRPVNAKVLHWIDPQSGDDVFSQFSAAVAPTRIFIKTIKAALEEYLEILAA